ncbi:MAG TPA: cytochrome d ubiquinol oxidase subunit II, partial [bacterium]|nr:cytochrome d ubiquinol oxidase subunit II [bacterium]
MLGTIWYALLALMLAAYVVLDGFDLGAGAILPLVARTPDERRLVIHSLGPVWDGNEVWLLAAGGTLVLAFPRVYAAAFSGFYLPLMMVLWLLVFRALSIELRHQAEKTLWLPLCDIAFAVSSLL